MMRIKIQIVDEKNEKLFTYKEGQLPEELVKFISLDSYKHSKEFHEENVLDEMVTELLNEWDENGLKNNSNTSN